MNKEIDYMTMMRLLELMLISRIALWHTGECDGDF
mgnify:CR=1 FL=1